MQANQLDQPITGMTYRQLRELIAEEIRAHMSDTPEAVPGGYVRSLIR